MKVKSTILVKAENKSCSNLYGLYEPSYRIGSKLLFKLETSWKENCLCP